MSETDQNEPSVAPVESDRFLHATGPAFKIRFQHIVFVVGISLCTTVLPVFLNKMPTGGDFLQHLRFAAAYKESLDSGKVLPDWTKENSGFGSVGVRVYPPLPALVVALIGRFVGDLYIAFAIALFGWMLVGCIGTFLFLRTFTTPTFALLGVFLFAVAPHHLLLVFRFFFYAEFVALSILPFCVLFLTRVLRRNKWADVLLLSLSCSALFLSHIPLTLISALVLVVYSLPILDPARIWGSVARLSAALVLSIGTTLFQSIKLVSEVSWVKHAESAFASGYFEFGNWLFPSSPFGSQMSARGISARSLDTDAVLMISIALPVLIWLVTAAKRDRDPTFRIIVALALSSIVCWFFASRASYLVWSNLSLLQNLQFPFRFLTPLAFLSAAALAIAGERAIRNRDLFGKVFSCVSLIVIVGIMVFDLRLFARPSSVDYRERFDRAIETLNDGPGSEWWWPVWARPTALENREKVSADGRVVNIAAWGTEKRDFTVEEGEATTVRVATFYYPYWKAEVNGQLVSVGPDASGSILLPIPGQRSHVRLYFDGGELYDMAESASIASICFIAIGMLLLARPFRRRGEIHPRNAATL